MHDAAPFAVHIHDNYIHHNQAVGGDGYGVTVGAGGYALIERNVFDWNRHAIEGDGSPDTGYVATANLVLEHGGLHRWNPFPGFWVHTHQFDMHGTEDCGVWDIFSDALANCGDAGLSMFIRQNTFFYAFDHAIKLRGTPEVGMFVGQNVFANHLRFSDAATQEETGLVEEPGNVYGYNGKLELGSCDLDGDGVLDSFMATGVTWWYPAAARCRGRICTRRRRDCPRWCWATSTATTAVMSRSGHGVQRRNEFLVAWRCGRRWGRRVHDTALRFLKTAVLVDRACNQGLQPRLVSVTPERIAG